MSPRPSDPGRWRVFKSFGGGWHARQATGASDGAQTFDEHISAFVYANYMAHHPEALGQVYSAPEAWGGEVCS